MRSRPARDLMTEEKIQLAEYLGVLMKEKRLIAAVVGAATFLAVVVSLVMPQVFQSPAVLLPPPNPGTGGLSIAADLPSLDILGFGKESAELTKLLAILKSRRILESAVRRFDLFCLPCQLPDHLHQRDTGRDIRDSGRIHQTSGLF